MNLDLSKIKHVHLIGIGGIGISAIARMMIEEGKMVSGQDMETNAIVEDLRGIGAEIAIGQSYDNIPKDADLIVYTVAIETYDPELFLKLKNEMTIPIRSYPEMLGIISKDRYTIAIAGTHGKTTTTGMIAEILQDADKNPMVIVGSLLQGKEGDKPTNFISGKSDNAELGGGYFVVEACEYRRSFLNIHPDMLLITNIDMDHLDYYKDLEDIKSAFRELAMKVPEDGYIICNPNDENIKDVIEDLRATIVDYDKYFDKDLGLKIPGIHNKKDAAAAKAAGKIIGIKDEDIDSSLKEFRGTSRRFELKGKTKNGVLVYDDYAHHPKEIMATLQGFRELYPKDDGWKITVIFQPHLFSRTKLLLTEFATSFADADGVITLPIYFAREEDDGTISSEILAKEISKNGVTAEAFQNFTDAESYIRIFLVHMNEKDLIVTMGAGEAFKIGDNLLKK